MVGLSARFVPVAVLEEGARLAERFESATIWDAFIRLPVADPQHLDEALQAAAAGFAVLSQTPPRHRAHLICEAARLMRGRQEGIARSIMLENGIALWSHPDSGYLMSPQLCNRLADLENVVAKNTASRARCTPSQDHRASSA